MAGDPYPIDPVALMGYGRFGRALAGLLAEAGFRVGAWDPESAVPDRYLAADPQELVEEAAIVVLATPIGAVRHALGSLVPHLDSTHVVIDVGSVKRMPTAAMSDLLGNRIPWAATHPLFGPTNVARGDRDLRAVVCPNSLHPEAVDTAQHLYERIGCTVVRQTPEDHDLVMARTHALAFFIAKGLIDIGAGDDLPFAPPSFQALAQTIETVRSDAGHLFLAIQRDNPDAPAARKALLDALSHVHDQVALAQSDQPDEATPRDLRIPPPAKDPPELTQTRHLIDELDREIVGLLDRRARLAARAAAIKARRHRPVRDSAREDRMLADRRAWAAELGLPEEAISNIFDAILRFSRTTQG